MRIPPWLALSLVAGCTTPPAKNPCGEPEVFVRELYAQYASDDAKPRDYATIFDSDTLGLIKRDHDLANGEVPWLAFDPVCNCQDWEKISVTQVKVTMTPTTKAAVVFTNAGQTMKQDFHLACTADGWRVHDIVVLPENTSLRAGLTKAIEEATSAR